MEKADSKTAGSLATSAPYAISDVDASSSQSKALNHEPGFKNWLRTVLLTVETSGIHRITDEERKENTTKIWHACTFWLSANMAVATLNVGAIGCSMGLSFWDSFAIILVVNLVSCLIPAWTAGFGLSGLRMTTFS
jgi:anti-sigma-K factor RskA